MSRMLIVHDLFHLKWPFVADRIEEHWRSEADGGFERIDLAAGDARPLGEIAGYRPDVVQLITLSVLATPACVSQFPNLRECVIASDSYSAGSLDEMAGVLEERGVAVYRQKGEGFWGQSVSEFALGLTICGLRRIPQHHHAIIAGPSPWYKKGEADRSRRQGAQFGDNPDFVNGTIRGKKVRIVGAGNIASRYASFTSMLGADVAAWDPFAPEPCFHRAGARRETRLERLVADADIFAPLIPLTEQTRDLIGEPLIRMLPKGALVVLATRSGICDMSVLRERVLANELSLAADVFDIEPLPDDDPLIGRDNVVHTPHNAGRTREANFEWADRLIDAFEPYDQI